MRASVTGIVQVKKQRTQGCCCYVKNQVNHNILLYFNQVLRKTKLKNQIRTKKTHIHTKKPPKTIPKKIPAWRHKGKFLSFFSNTCKRVCPPTQGNNTPACCRSAAQPKSSINHETTELYKIIFQHKAVAQQFSRQAHCTGDEHITQIL